MACNLPKLTAKLELTTHQIDINSCKRIIYNAKHSPYRTKLKTPLTLENKYLIKGISDNYHSLHLVAEAEELECILDNM